MITNERMHASLAAADLARARSWYADKLGWEPTQEPPGVLVYEVLGSAFTLFETEFAGTAKNTVLSWDTTDVVATVARLRDRGVVFEDYDMGEDFKTVDGIATDPDGGKIAWFKDSEGNIVGLTQATDGGGPESLSAMLAAADLDRAKAWYADKLGFEPVGEYEGVLAAYQSAGTSFNLYRTEFAGTAKNTVAVWRFKGIRDEVARLRGRGVVFEEYDYGDEGKTVGGILSDAEGDDAAWFKDSEGNILALVEDRM